MHYDFFKMYFPMCCLLKIAYNLFFSLFLACRKRIAENQCFQGSSGEASLYFELLQGRKQFAA